MAHKQASREKEQTLDSKEIMESHSVEQAMVPPISSSENKSLEGNLSCEQAVEDSPLKNSAIKDSGETKGNEDLNWYLPLYGAALEGDWESAEKFLDKHPDAVKARITNRSETALHIAVTGGKAMKFVKKLVGRLEPNSIALDDNRGTALFYAAAVGNTEVARLLVTKSPKLTRIPSKYGDDTYTPLHMAARNGHKDTVEYLVSVMTTDSHESTNFVPDRTPVYSSHSVDPTTTDEYPCPFKGPSGVRLLKNLISPDLIGIALDLLKKPHLGLAEEEDLHSFILPTLAQKPSMFESGSMMGYWKRKVYPWIKIPKEEDNNKNSPKDSSAASKNMVGEDIENPIDSPKDCCATFKNTFGTMRGKVFVMLKNTINQMVSCIIHIYQTKMMHAQTLETVKLMLEKMTLSEEKASEFLKEPLFRAIELGILELVKEIIKAYPPSVLFLDNEDRNIIQLAVLHRQEKVFLFIYTSGLYRRVMGFKDKQGNNLLHFVGMLQPSSQVSGPALLMQREFQWLKVVEILVPASLQEQKTKSSKKPKEEKTDSSKKSKKEKTELSKCSEEEKAESSKKPKKEKTESSKCSEEQKAESSKKPKKQKTESSKCSEGLTPRQLFTKQHADLVEKGEKWMKEIASSCSVVASLIVTMVFAAAFTVPGGNNSEGKPIFLHTPVFIVFAISDALGLFSSIISILMFLVILTARYSQEDFLESLPKKLIFALISFFFSITSVMVAFGAALYIVLVDIFKWVFIPIALLACLPVILFAWLQFPLLVDVFRSTYRCEILRAVKRGKNSLA